MDIVATLVYSGFVWKFMLGKLSNIDKNIFQKNLKQKRKKVLMIKRQNQMNARRIENANKFKK